MAHKIEIFGVIGVDFWDLGVSAKSVVAELKRIARDEDDKDVQLHINSGGGYVDDAVQMYNRLRRHAKETGGKITVVVDALAASAATIIAMAGDEIIAEDGATIMIHSPWGMNMGTAEEMRDYADLLDRTEDSMVRMYLRQASDLEEDDLRDMLTAETWLTASEAKDFGLVDTVNGSDEPAEDVAMRSTSAAMAYINATAEDERLPKYQHAPAWASGLTPSRRDPFTPARMRASATPEEDISMKDETKPNTSEAQASTVSANSTAVTAVTPAPAAPSISEADVQAAVVAERKRVNTITALCERHDLPELQVNLIQNGVLVEKANGIILDAIAEKKSNTPNILDGGIRVEVDEAENRVMAVQKSIELRAGLLTPAEAREERAKNPHTSCRLDTLAMMFAERKTGSRLDILGSVMASGGRPMGAAVTHTSSDFTNLLLNVAHKSMLKGWDQVEETFEPWTNRGILTDFKATSRVGMNHFPELEELGDGGEYKGVTTGDRGETIQLASYGNLFDISRQAMINDDLNAFTKVPMRMGSAAKRTVGTLVYNVLTANAVLGQDGIALFDAATHNNLQTSDIDAAGLAEMKTAMRTQTDPDGGATLSIRPAYMIVPAVLELPAQQLLNTTLTSDGTTTITNVQQGDVSIIVEPRLDANSAVLWYLAASGALYDTVEVSYLDGNDMPFLDQQEGWSVDGTSFKVRIDVGVAALDFRALQRGDNT